MKKIIGMVIIILLASLVSVGSVSAKQVLNFSSSAQIADAFGKSVIERIESEYPLEVDVTIVSSETALQRLVNGFSELACIAYPLPNEYRQKGYVEMPFARDNVAVITSKSNPVQNISSSQLQKIFIGNIKNWQELGGKDQKIVTIGPNRATAGCDNFCRQIMRGHKIEYNYTTDISTRVMEGVKNLPGGIAFVSYAAMADEEKLKALDVDNISVQSSEYPITQKFSLVTKGEPGSDARIFIDAVFTEEGKEVMRKKGLNPLMPDIYNATTMVD